MPSNTFFYRPMTFLATHVLTQAHPSFVFYDFSRPFPCWSLLRSLVISTNFLLPSIPFVPCDQPPPDFWFFPLLRITFSNMTMVPFHPLFNVNGIISLLERSWTDLRKRIIIESFSYFSKNRIDVPLFCFASFLSSSSSPSALYRNLCDCFLFFFARNQ